VGDNYRYIIAFIIPVVLIGISAFTRKIMRKTDFCWQDFYLGVDLTIAAFSIAVINVLDLTEPEGTIATTAKYPHAGSNAALYIVGCFVAFVVLIAFHQQWKVHEEPTPISENSPNVLRSKTGRKEIILLAFASNLIGAALLGSFILLKIEGKI
jgi:hypothetical protein